MSSARWNDVQISHLLDAILEELARSGRKSDGAAIQGSTWTNILASFNQSAFPVEYTRDQIQAKYTQLKPSWKEWTQLLDTSGVGWDEDKQIPPKDYGVEKNPRAAPFRKETLYERGKMEEIFRGRLATGRRATASGSFVTGQLTPNYTSYEAEFDNEIAGSTLSLAHPVTIVRQLLSGMNSRRIRADALYILIERIV